MDYTGGLVARTRSCWTLCPQSLVSGISNHDSQQGSPGQLNHSVSWYYLYHILWTFQHILSHRNHGSAGLISPVRQGMDISFRCSPSTLRYSRDGPRSILFLGPCTVRPIDPGPRTIGYSCREGARTILLVQWPRGPRTTLSVSLKGKQYFYFRDNRRLGRNNTWY